MTGVGLFDGTGTSADERRLARIAFLAEKTP
jgi:hypothetical protein